MTLRSRLTAAFFAISVIPLSAVTLFSYYSSERALRRAAEQQASVLSSELGRRMEWLTSDLERRMDRVWPMPQEQAAVRAPDRRASPPGAPAAPQPPSSDMAGHLAAVLGDAAPMIESMELMPGPDAPLPPRPDRPTAGTPPTGRERVTPAPVPPPNESRTRLKPESGYEVAQLYQVGPGGKVTVEMSRVIDMAMEAYALAGTAGQSDLTAWSKAMQERVRQAAGAGVPAEREVRRLTQEMEAARRTAARLQADADKARTDRLRAVTEMKGAEVDSSVRRDGQEVGRIHARLNLPRVFRTILPGRRSEGEVSFAIDANGEIHAPDADKATVSALKSAGAIPGEGATVHSGGNWVVVTSKGPAGMTFGTARPLGDDLRELRAVAARNFGVGFGLIALVFFASVPLAGGMTRNLRTLMHGVHAVARGDLSARVPVRSNDEFGRLAAAFNQMAEALAAHEKLVVQQERLQRELELCRQIQTDMLPHEPLRLGLAEVQGVSIPAREVGGDFFNYFVLPTGEIALLLGDVSGKGVGAALLMANVQATLRARLPLEGDLAKLAGELDRELSATTPPEVYLTIFVGVVNADTRVLRYVNAGHNTQFILREGAGIERMPSTGRPLGLLPGGGYEECVTRVPPGDLLFFYSDGMVEAQNEAGEEFGTERLEATLLAAAAPGESVDAVLSRVEAAVRDFRGRADLSDDATIMALRLGNGA